MNLFFALLAFAAVLAGIMFAFGAARSARPALTSAALPLAASIAATAMLGSLYYSEIKGYIPCELCWYQRIAMYSLAIILVVAVIRQDRRIAPYGLTLATIGLGISAYHYFVQMFPRTASCGLDASCAVQWVDVFGFVSIPLMAGAGFFGVGACMLYLLKVRTP